MNWLKKWFTEDSRFPHEVHPELLEWEIGDKIHQYTTSHNYEIGEYLGILDGQINILEKYEQYIHKFTPKKSSKLLNNSLAKRKLDAEKQRIKDAVYNDHYNQFLALVRENNKRLAEEWFQDKV